MYKCISFELRDRQVDADHILFKVPTIPEEVQAYQQPVDVEELISDLTLQQLNDIFQAVLKRQKGRVDPIRSKFGEIKKEEVSMEAKLTYMNDYVSTHKHFSFRQVLENASSKVEVIVTFLVVLEMMKAGKITIVQENLFDDITIESLVAA